MQEILGMTHSKSILWKRRLLYRYGHVRVKSILGNPALFGWFMTIMALLFMAFYCIYKKVKYILLSLIFYIGNLLTFTKKSIIGFLLSVVLLFTVLLYKKKINWRNYVIILLFFFIISSFHPSIIDMYGSLKRDYITPETNQVARKALYFYSVKIAKDNFPWGKGFGRYGGWISRIYYSPVYEEYNMHRIEGISKEDPIYITDTFWPHVLGEIGVIGFILYLLLVFYVFKDITTKLFHKITEIQLLSFFSFLVFIEAAVESLAMPIFEHPIGIYYVFGITGIAFSLKKRDAN